MKKQVGTWTVVVARTGVTAKSRLAGILAPWERAALTRAMLSDLLGAIDATARLAVDRAVLVTDTPEGLAIGRSAGPATLSDLGLDMNGAVAAGLALAEAQGATSALVLPADLPYVTPGALDTVVASIEARAADVALVMDHTGTGTNALWLRLPTSFRTAFGLDSADRHEAIARAAGLSVMRLESRELARDLDSPADLAMLLAHFEAPSAARWAPATLVAARRMADAVRSAT